MNDEINIRWKYVLWVLVIFSIVISIFIAVKVNGMSNQIKLLLDFNNYLFVTEDNEGLGWDCKENFLYNYSNSYFTVMYWGTKINIEDKEYNFSGVSTNTDCSTKVLIKTIRR